MKATIMDISQFSCCLADSNITVYLTMYNNYRVMMDFNWINTLYTFDVDHWSGRGLTAFVTLFLSHTPRDINTFGSINQLDGTLTVTGIQKQQIIVQACKDIFHSIDLIVEKHGRSLLDYAVWYHDKRIINPSNYPEYITKLACNCIVHGELLAPGILYDVVQFDH
eukprot:NODE_1053_length_2425_cov_0.855976.p2 type:complete len:166 gc:universal NODE_1053_length_2425_cov_0.855976:2226-1729(-)